MSKYEIRLRRQKFTSRGSEPFRDYGAVLQRHEKEMRIKKLVRVFSFLFIILIVVMLIIILINVESSAMGKTNDVSRASVNYFNVVL